MQNSDNDDIPKSIQISNFNYSFKEKRANNRYVYRCRTRKCGFLILLDKDNLEKIINKKENESIEFTKLSKKEHTCRENKVSIPINEIMTVNENIKLAEDLIRKNLEKPEDWHYQNLINNNCQLSKIKIKIFCKNLGI